MVKSKGWDWEVVQGDFREVWKNPSIESYYLLNRWKSQNKKTFLDLGCGLGRHAILFGKNKFEVFCFDISEEAIKKTKEWADDENLKFDYQVGDMLKLPYPDNFFDGIYGKNVISHTDTKGVKVVLQELKRVLKKNGECYLTLCSKETWGFQREDWPLLDPNTRVRMEEGPEYNVPHFYVDYPLIKELFVDFEIVHVHEEVDFHDKEEGFTKSYHFHVLVRKK